MLVATFLLRTKSVVQAMLKTDSTGVNMSSMEVDVPLPVTNFGDSKKSPNGHGHKVQFDTTANIKVVSMIPDMQQQQHHPKHKSRRRARVPKLDIGEEETSMISSAAKPPSPSKLKKLSEKERHSRTGIRGQPKKGGGGGKGTWGKITDDMYAETVTRDSNDPNYESNDDEITYLVSPSTPLMDMEDFEKAVTEIFKEYFDHGDTEEVATSLEELNVKNIKHKIVCIVITLALEEKPANREMVSVLLSDMYGHKLNGREMAKGFDAVLSQLEDLVLDTPDAAVVVGNFMARCVADDCLPPSFITNHVESINQHVNDALKRARLLLNMKHSVVRLDSVWGVGGGQRPVMLLISKMNLLLKEFLSAADFEEATHCLTELEVPHFHHELVYEGLVMVMEVGSEECAKMISSLFANMFQTGVISRDQFNTGFTRVFNNLTDIVLDIPNAYHTLSKFVERGREAGFVSQQVADEIPSRGRKRFVSEGDGGAVKSPED